MHKKAEEPKENSFQYGKRLSFIEELPAALHHYSLFPFLPGADLYNLRVTSKAMRADYDSSPQVPRKLLTHIVQGEEKQALAMLDVHSGLLLCASNATDYSGRTYNNYTPFQAALLCHDVMMWKKIEPYFDRLTNGEEEKARQFNAILPEGIPWQRAYDFSVLAKTITDSSTEDVEAALKKTQNDTEICQALNLFRGDFKALSVQEIFFNPLHLIESLSIYNEQLNDWSWPQRHLFWRQVIGYTERFVPARYAQALAQAESGILQEQQILRSFKFRYGGSYFPLAGDSSGLGFDYGVYGSFPRTNGILVRREFIEYTVRNYVENIYYNYFELSEACNVSEASLVTTIP